MTEPQNPQQSLPPHPGTPVAPPGGAAYQPAPVAQGDPNVRPGTVTAAAWISLALSALGLLSALFLISVTSRVVNYVIEHPEELDIQSSDLPTADEGRAALTGLAVIIIAASTLAIFLAIAVLKRQRWARIALVIMSALTALVSIPFSLAAIGLPWLAGSITVIVLLFTDRANRWFQGSGNQRP